MATAQDFDIALRQFADEEIPEKVRKLQQRVVSFVNAGVINKSPVDTGAFQNNWTITLNQPIAGTIKQEDALPPTPPASAAKLAKIEPFSNVWINNNLVYAERLEAGHSQQAPNGIVAPTIAEARVKFGAA